MPEIHIDPGETEMLVASDDTDEYYATVTGTDVDLGRGESEARTRGRTAKAGDRGPFMAEDNEEVYAYNPSATETAVVHLDHNGFLFEREARAVVGSVFTSSQNEAAPAHAEFVQRQGRAVDVNSNPVAESIEAPDRADTIVVAVDDAAGSFAVYVEFQDGDGNEVVTRGPGDNGDYSGNSSTDVFVEVAVAANDVEVRIEDTSGAANTVDYSVYAR